MRIWKLLMRQAAYSCQAQLDGSLNVIGNLTSIWILPLVWWCVGRSVGLNYLRRQQGRYKFHRSYQATLYSGRWKGVSEIELALDKNQYQNSKSKKGVTLWNIRKRSIIMKNRGPYNRSDLCRLPFRPAGRGRPSNISLLGELVFNRICRSLLDKNHVMPCHAC